MECTIPGAPFCIERLAETELRLADVRRLYRQGRIQRLFRSVYADATAQPSVALALSGLATVVTSDQVVVDRTAALLYGVDTYSPAEHAAGLVVEVCAGADGVRVRRPGVRGRRRTLAMDDVVVMDDVRVTTPLRTALDLGRHLRRREAFAAMCMLVRVCRLAPDDLVARTPLFAGRRGVIQLRELAGLVDPRVESQREAWTLLEIIDAGLPRPTPQHWITIAGVPTYRLDFAYVEARVYVEYDGEASHSTPEQIRHDRERRDWLRRNGWQAVIIKSGDFTGSRRDNWVHQIREALASAYSTRRW